jgi:hypothetical protein
LKTQFALGGSESDEELAEEKTVTQRKTVDVNKAAFKPSRLKAVFTLALHHFHLFLPYSHDTHTFQTQDHIDYRTFAH